MMQQTDVLFHLQQQNAATSMSDLHESLSALPEQLLTQANSATTSTIILNCSELESINSHGISLLILLLIYSRRQQKRLQVFGLSEHNRYIFEITSLSKFIDIADTSARDNWFTVGTQLGAPGWFMILYVILLLLATRQRWIGIIGIVGIAVAVLSVTTPTVVILGIATLIVQGRARTRVALP